MGGWNTTTRAITGWFGLCSFGRANHCPCARLSRATSTGHGVGCNAKCEVARWDGSVDNLAIDMSATNFLIHSTKERARILSPCQIASTMAGLTLWRSALNWRPPFGAFRALTSYVEDCSIILRDGDSQMYLKKAQNLEIRMTISSFLRPRVIIIRRRDVRGERRWEIYTGSCPLSFADMKPKHPRRSSLLSILSCSVVFMSSP